MSAGAVPYPIVPPLPEYEKKAETGDTRTTGGGVEEKRIAPIQQEALAGLDTAVNEQIAGTDEVKKHKEAEAAVSSEVAGGAARLATLQEARTGAAIDQGAKLRDQAVATHRAEVAKLDAMPSPKFFRDGDTWGNALRGFALALSAAGDAMRVGAAVRTGQAPPAVHTAQTIVESDLAQQRADIQRQSDRVVMAKTGIADADEARRKLLADIDLRGERAYARLEAIGKARLAALGLKGPEIEQHQTILAIKAARAQKQADYVAPAWQSISKTWQDAHKSDVEETNRVPTKTNTSPVGAADVEHVNQLQTDISKLDRTIDLMERDPAAAEAWRKNEETWRQRQPLRESKAGQLGQAVGLINIAPEQGLKDEPSAKQIHQGMAQVSTSIAKGYGGVITEGDRQAAGSEIAALANTPAEQVESLKRTRDLLKTKLDTYQQNRGVTLPTPIPAAAPTQPPPFQQGGAAPTGAHNPGAAGSTPAPATNAARGLAVQAVRSNPSDPRAAGLRRYWNITDQELR